MSGQIKVDDLFHKLPSQLYAENQTGRDRHGQLRGHQRFYYWDEEIYYWESGGNETNLLTRVDENYWHDFCKKYQQKCFWAESEVDEAEKSWA